MTVPSDIEDGRRCVLFRTTEDAEVGREAGGPFETCWTRVVLDDGPTSMPRDLAVSSDKLRVPSWALKTVMSPPESMLLLDFDI